MSSEIANINENTFMQGATLHEAVFKFGDAELIQAYKSSLSSSPVTHPKTPDSLLGVLQSAAITLNNAQNNKYDREKIYSNLQKDILGFIKKGDLMPFGFKEPRAIGDKPIKIPADLFFSGKIDWANSELKYKTLEFSGIRLLGDLLPVIDIKADKAEFSEIKRIGNSKLNKSIKSNQLNFSELEPDRYINEKQAAEFLGISFKTLQGYRVKGGGPEFRKFGAKTVRYKFADLQEWAESRKKKNTSQIK